MGKTRRKEMKKGMFLVLFVFAVLSVSACASKQTSVQTGPVANDHTMSVFMDYASLNISSETGNDQEWVTVHIIVLNRPATTKEVLQYMDEQKLKPATVEYLIAVNRRYPDLMKDYVLVAPNSGWPVWFGTIYYSNGQCQKFPCWEDSNYYSKFLFFAVAK